MYAPVDTAVDDDFDPRKTAKPPAQIKCGVCGAVGDWPQVTGPSYFLSCFRCDIKRGRTDLKIDVYRNDLQCGGTVEGVKCQQYGCQKWYYVYHLCTKCNPPPKPGRVRKPVKVNFNAHWIEPGHRLIPVASNTARYLDGIVVEKTVLGVTNAKEIESTIVKRNDTGDAKVITDLHTTIADLWPEPPTEVTLILHKRK